MKFGYMPGSGDIKTQVEFARKYFDFIEITYPNSLLINSDRTSIQTAFSPHAYRAEKKLACDSPQRSIVGHMHWGINLSTNSAKEVEKACGAIRFFKAMGAKKVTIHPSYNNGLSEKEVIENNIKSISRIKRSCGKIKLLVENTTHEPFCHAESIKALVSKISGLGVTLDTGHACLTSKEELGSFLHLLGKKIKHVHLHDVRHNQDHLFFKSKAKMKGLVVMLQKAGYNATVTLEMFYELEGKGRKDVVGRKRRELLLKQISWIGHH